MNKDVLDFIRDGMDYSDYDWTTPAQVYGILSRFAFIAKKHAEDMEDCELSAYMEAERSLFEDGEINAKAFKVLIESIEKWAGSKYKLDILDEIEPEEDKEKTIKNLVKQIIDLIEGE